VEQKLLTLPEHLNSPLVFSGVRVTRSLVLYVCFVDRCLSFCIFLLAIVLSVLLRYTDSANKEAIEPSVKLKTSLPNFYDCHRDLVDRYGIFVSHITTDMFHLS
jgi:hypothetical protein